jgi:hypothetical protein
MYFDNEIDELEYFADTDQEDINPHPPENEDETDDVDDDNEDDDDDMDDDSDDDDVTDEE